MKNRSLIIIMSFVALVLSIPFIAMQFSEAVNWGVFDFVIAALLLSGLGFAIDFAIRKVKKFDYRLMLIIAIVGVFLLIWAELAVGIFGTPFAGS